MLSAVGVFWAKPMSVDVCVGMLTAGLCLIFLELNRPGRVLPGSLGLLLTLLAIARLRGVAVQPAALSVLLGSALLLLANLWYRLPWACLAAATAGLCWGLLYLTHGLVQVWVAVSCGLVLGIAGALLSRIALRARRAKQIN